MPSLGTPVAVIDCGTNSTRLLVKAGSVALERRMRDRRLGRSTDRTGRLDADGVTRTLEALAEYREVVEAHGARDECVRWRRKRFARRPTARLRRPRSRGAGHARRGDRRVRRRVVYAFLGATSEVDECRRTLPGARHRGRVDGALDRHRACRGSCRSRWRASA